MSMTYNMNMNMTITGSPKARLGALWRLRASEHERRFGEP